MIKAENLIKQYNGNTVLDLPELVIKKGESFGLVGNNGAGKTTFFSLILDLISATNGRVLSNGVDVKQSDHWKSYTGSYLDEGYLIDFLNPMEYFEFIAEINGITKTQYEKFLQSFEELFNGEVLNNKKLIRELSKGNQKKVGIAAALLVGPEVLILDEPFPHLDPSTVIRLKKVLKTLARDSSTTLLISSHDLSHVTEICSRIAVLEKGKIVRDINTDENTLAELQQYFTA